jgi:AraC-like DNA-binding protein
LDAWRSHYHSFNTIDIEPKYSRGFTAKNEVWPLGPMAISRNIAPGGILAREMRHVRRDSIDHWVIRVAKTGTTSFRSKAGQFVARPKVPFLLSLGDVSISERDQADWTSLYLPRDSFPDLTAGLDRIGPNLMETPMGMLLGDYLWLLEKRLSTMTTADVPKLVATTQAMVAACVVHDISAKAATPGDIEITRRERIRQVIQAHLGSPRFGPEQLCNLARISRSQLYRMFEPSGGVVHYIQLLRLRAAHAMLSDPQNHNDVQAIARQVGFFDPSSFSRAFRREFRCSPTEVRSLSACDFGLPAAKNLTPAQSAIEFDDLLRHVGAT